VTALELTFRATGVVLLACLAFLLLRTRRRDHTARLGAALCASVGAFLLTSMPHAGQVLGPLLYPLTAVCSTHPVFFWLFCAALFTDGFVLRRWQLACIAGMAVLGLTYQWLFTDQHGIASGLLVRAVGAVFGAASLAFACLGPLAVWRGSAADLDERRRQVRGWFVPIASTYLAITVIVQAIALYRSTRTPHALVIANLLILDTLAAAALLSFLKVRVANWLEVVEPAGRPVDLSRLERSVLQQLERRLVPERLYAREGLTIATLASLLDTQDHVLRRVINRGLGFRNFNDFLHFHRLREAAARLRSAAERRVPILTIALDSGYASIGPFNRAFRQRFGMTPSEYRRDGGSESPAVAGTPAPSDAHTSRPA
jgi:AraC-like DNA-binding protein